MPGRERPPGSSFENKIESRAWQTLKGVPDIARRRTWLQRLLGSVRVQEEEEEQEDEDEEVTRKWEREKESKKDRRQDSDENL